MDHDHIDYEGLIAAIETEMPNVEHYLELRTGNVLTIVTAPPRNESHDGDAIARENLVLSQKIYGEPEAFERVPSIGSDLGLKWMRAWAEDVQNQQLREHLLEILTECTDDCFRQFRRELLAADEDLREDWFEYRAAKLHEFISTWLGAGTKTTRH